MRSSVTTLLALGLALSQTSSAIPTPAVTANKREAFNLPASTKFITCPGYLYSTPQAAEAIQEGIRHLQAGTKVYWGSKGYPEEFHNSPERFPFELDGLNPACKLKRMHSFPLLPSSQIYKGGNPKVDRVVFYWYGNGLEDGSYCATMSHEGLLRNRFDLCRSRA